jgi:hypothetical protein
VGSKQEDGRGSQFPCGGGRTWLYALKPQRFKCGGWCPRRSCRQCPFNHLLTQIELMLQHFMITVHGSANAEKSTGGYNYWILCNLNSLEGN